MENRIYGRETSIVLWVRLVLTVIDRNYEERDGKIHARLEEELLNAVQIVRELSDTGVAVSVSSLSESATFGKTRCPEPEARTGANG